MLDEITKIINKYTKDKLEVENFSSIEEFDDLRYQDIEIITIKEKFFGLNLKRFNDKNSISILNEIMEIQSSLNICFIGINFSKTLFDHHQDIFDTVTILDLYDYDLSKFHAENLKSLSLNLIDTISPSHLDITKIKNIEKLHIYNITNNHNLNNIKYLKNLKEITIEMIANDIKNNVKVDLDFLATTKNVISLNVYNVQELDLNKISNEKLQSLDLKSIGNIVNIDKLFDFINLESLTIFNYDVNDTFNSKKTKQLKKLTHINLNKCKINNLGCITELTEINQLFLNRNNIRDISSLYKLQKLKILFASNCAIEDISVISSMPNLKNALFSNCNIINIPLNILKEYRYSNDFIIDHNEKSLYLDGNPIENPPLEILHQGDESINEYFSSMVGINKNLNESKVIVIGEGAAGKTSLMRRISDDTFSEVEQKTHGINIRHIVTTANNGEIVNSSIWDFGGQQIMHATHQLFLSRRCVYILVLDNRKDERPEYWLQQVNSLGGNSPILVVTNKCDQHQLGDLQKRRLKEKHPNIIGFFDLSCKTKQGLDTFSNELNKTILSLPMRKIKLSKNWFDVKEQIQELSRIKDHLPLDNFREICSKNGINNPKAKEVLLTLLHDLGIIIHFKELTSHDMGILNPQWITDGIYAILNSESLAKNNGKISKNNAQSVLDYSCKSGRYDNKAHYVMSVMEQFELCYMISKDIYLIPDLLPSEIKNDTFKTTKQNTLNFIFSYNHYLPPSLVPRFMVKMKSEINSNEMWRTGAILRNTEYSSTAKFETDHNEKKIYISVIGNQIRDYFSLIRKAINDINNDFDKNSLGLEELIALPHSEEYVSYEELIGYEINSKKEYFSGKLGRPFSVQSLLSGIESSEATKEKIKQTMEYPINFMINNNIENNSVNSLNNTSNQSTDVTTQVDINISNEISLVFDNILNLFEDLQDDIDGNPNLKQHKEDFENEMKRTQRSLDKIQTVQNKEDVNNDTRRNFTRILTYLQETLEGKNTTGKLINTLGKYYESAQSIGKKYNKIASNLGLPAVPDVLL